MKYASIFLIIMFIAAGCMKSTEKVSSVTSSIVTKEVTYSSDGTTLKGYLAYDSSKAGRRPGIIIVHEWWGLNQYAKTRAEMLAKLGYTALAIDMYGNGAMITHPDDAGKFASEVMSSMDTASARFNAGLKFLKSQPETDTSKIAAIGYCFGGGVALRMALGGTNLTGVVSFHGDLPTAAVKDPQAVKAKFLVCNGAADPLNPPEKVKAFEDAIKTAKLKYTLINYPGAKHSFTVPGSDSLGQKYNMPLSYNKAADEASWQEMQDFFSGIFK